jgi:hypothetical protein
MSSESNLSTPEARLVNLNGRKLVSNNFIQQTVLNKVSKMVGIWDILKGHGIDGMN